LTCLPLPLEIAAAQTRYFSLVEIEQRLADSLGEGHGLPSLQKTVRQTLEWSFALLSAEERELLLRLAVFHGGISPEAAKGISPDEYGIESLVGLDEKALIYRGTDGDSERYFLLPPVQDFVLSRALRDGAVNRCRVEHARYFQDFAKECAKQVTVSSTPPILGLLNQEIDNIRAVVDFLENTNPTALPALVSDLTEPLYLCGYVRERAKWVELSLQLLENGHTEATPAVLARLYRSRTLGLLSQDRAREAEEPIRAAVEWARSANDTNFLAATLATRGLVERGIRRYDASIAYFEEARTLYQEAHSTRGEVVALNGLITVGIRANRLDMATQCCLDAISLCRRANDRYGLTLALSNLGYITYQRSDVRKALSFYAEALRVAEDMENAPQVGIALMNLGDIVRKHQEREVGVNLLVIAEQLLRRLGHNLAAEAEQYLNEETVRISAEKMEAIRREYGRRTLPGLLRSRPWKPLVAGLSLEAPLSAVLG
jgi:tetratricopeptide (TPR) repeat protein